MYTHLNNDKIFERAFASIAGGVLSNFKKEVHSAPVFVESGEGCTLKDFDGNTWLDFSLSAGPAILGHSNQAYRDALKKQIDRMYTNGDSLVQIEAAEKLKEMIPCAELVRFQVSGADAVFNAIRVARSYTGKNMYVKFKGQYNGGMDYVLGGATEKGSYRAKDQIDPEDYYSRMCYTEGRALHALDDCFLIEWNDLNEIRALFEEAGDEIACVVMEPCMLNMNGCVPEPGYLEGVRELCDRYHAVLIFDETITGFRVAPGGAAEYFGVIPDISTFAKALGGGFPVAAMVGKREIMNVISDVRVMAVGTYNGHPLAAAAVLETIRQMQENDGEAFRKIRKNTDILREGLLAKARELEVPMIVQGVPGAIIPLFTEKEKIINQRDAIENADFQKHCRFMKLLKQNGVLHNTRLCLSPIHREEELQGCIERAEKALRMMKEEGGV